VFENIKWRIEVQLSRYPVTLFQLGVFILHHESSLAVTLLVGAFLADRQFRQIGVVDRWSSEIWKIIRFVKKHSLCGFKRIDLTTVLTPDLVRRYQSRLLTASQVSAEAALRNLLHLKSVDEHLQQRTKIYVVSKRDAQEKPCPTAFTADLGGFIFITEKPEHIVGVQRFYMLHELGHLSQFSTYTTRRARVGGAPFFVVFIWAFPQLVYPENTFWSFLALGTFLLVIQMFRDVFWYFVRLEGAGHDEMAADQFALRNISKKELFTVATFYQRWPIPVDQTLHPALDGMRRKILSINLKQAFENRGRIPKPVALPQQVRTEWPVWVCLALSVALIPFANTPSEPVTAALAVLSLMSLNLLWMYWFRTRTLERWIERVLSSDLPPAESVSWWPSEPWWQKRLRVILGYEAKGLPTTTPPPLPWPLGKVFTSEPASSTRDEDVLATKSEDQAGGKRHREQ
jgi:hypothetical protein